jgi:hypothetical protein
MTGNVGGPMDSERLEQFEAEIARRRLKGGSAEPERRLAVAGGILVVAGLVLLLFAIAGTRTAATVEAQNDYLVLCPFGLALAVVGSVIWGRHSLTRYLRFWLVRVIYESRAQTDRVVSSIDGTVQNPGQDAVPMQGVAGRGDPDVS